MVAPFICKWLRCGSFQAIETHHMVGHARRRNFSYLKNLAYISQGFLTIDGFRKSLIKVFFGWLMVIFRN